MNEWNINARVINSSGRSDLGFYYSANIMGYMLCIMKYAGKGNLM